MAQKYVPARMRDGEGLPRGRAARLAAERQKKEGAINWSGSYDLRKIVLNNHAGQVIVEPYIMFASGQFSPVPYIGAYTDAGTFIAFALLQISEREHFKVSSLQVSDRLRDRLEMLQRCGAVAGLLILADHPDIAAWAWIEGKSIYKTRAFSWDAEGVHLISARDQAPDWREIRRLSGAGRIIIMDDGELVNSAKARFST